MENLENVQICEDILYTLTQILEELKKLNLSIGGGV